MASHNYLPVATEEQDASRRPSNEEPSEDISSILEVTVLERLYVSGGRYAAGPPPSYHSPVILINIRPSFPRRHTSSPSSCTHTHTPLTPPASTRPQEALNDDGLPHDLSPLLDDSTIGVKDLAAAAASRDRKSAATRQPDVESATGSPPASSICCRAAVILNFLLTVILLGLIGFLSFEIGPVIRDEYWGTNQTSPGLPSVAETFDKIKESFAEFTDRRATGPSLYDPAIYPWAEDPRSFLETVKKGQAAVAAARKALWDARMPNAEAIFPHVDVWNEEHLTKKFNRALLGQGKFVIGVMGTSVTAGHDNLFNQSFPVLWGQLMQEAFTVAGVELVVRNHAMGWNPIHPSYFCVGEIAGQDADVIMWEFGMMAGANEDMEIEQFIRSAILMPGQPHILICDPGEGQRKPKEGEVLERRTNTPPAPWKKAAMDWYIDDGFSFATNQLMQSFMFLDHLPEYQYGTFYLKDKVTDRPAGWHPGPHGHRFRAEILAWNYLGFFEKALAGVHEKIAAKEADLSSLLPEKLVVPPPTQCQPELCGELAQCSTSFEPREGGGLMERVIFPKEVPFVKDSEQARTNAVKTWHEQLYFGDVAAVDHMLDNGWNYLDRKYIIQGDKNAGPLQLEFESTTENYFVVCSAPGNAYLCKEGTVWKIDDEVVRCLDTEAAKTAGTPFVDAPCYISDRKIPAGKHIFELERLASDTKDEGTLMGFGNGREGWTEDGQKRANKSGHPQNIKLTCKTYAHIQR